MKDRKIKCADCEKVFLFTAGEQEYFFSRGLKTPVRCRECRRLARVVRERNEIVSLMKGGPMRLYSGHGRGFFSRLRTW